MELVDGESLH